MMTTREIIALARKHVVFTESEHKPSARFCLESAINQFDNGDFYVARTNAIKSIAYSVGVFHPDYLMAAK